MRQVLAYRRSEYRQSIFDQGFCGQYQCYRQNYAKLSSVDHQEHVHFPNTESELRQHQPIMRLGLFLRRLRDAYGNTKRARRSNLAT